MWEPTIFIAARGSDLAAPKGRSQQDEEGKDLQAAKQHGQDQDPFGGGGLIGVVERHITKTGSQVIQASTHSRERGDKVDISK